MENISIFLAKFWGWYLIIFFVILTFNPKFLITTSLVAIIVGLLNILAHNIWEPNWKLIITLIGWIALFIGLALFVFPKRTVAFLEFINIKFVQVIYTLLFLVGLLLLNIVYGLVPY
mgnify:CR=1 FL=1